MDNRIALLAALATLMLSHAGPAHAKPSGTIACPLDTLGVTTRQKLGDALVNGDIAAHDANFANARGVIGQATATCAKIYGWSDSRIDAASAWGFWKLMADALQRSSGLSAADTAILRSYVDQEPKLLDGLDHVSPEQRSAIISILRKRGAHLHDTGDASDRELGAVLFLKEMHATEKDFGAS